MVFSRNVFFSKCLFLTRTIDWYPRVVRGSIKTPSRYIPRRNGSLLSPPQGSENVYHLQFTPPAPDPCENSKGMDVAFVVDKTSSLGVTNFLLLKGFLLELIAAMHIGPDATHTGIITFNRKPKVLSSFADEKYYSNDAVHQKISGIPVVLGDRTFTDKALLAADRELFTEKGGDRPKFPNVLILLTDGRTNPKSKPFSEITPLLKVRLTYNRLFLKCSFQYFHQLLVTHYSSLHMHDHGTRILSLNTIVSFIKVQELNACEVETRCPWGNINPNFDSSRPNAVSKLRRIGLRWADFPAPLLHPLPFFRDISAWDLTSSSQDCSK